MREDESQYWDAVAIKKGVEGDFSANFNDNIWKRAEQTSRILAHRPVDARVLEIGCGHGLLPSMIRGLLLGNFHYTGTDVSAKFCEFMKRQWGLTAVHTDITALPDGPYDMVWLFDTLEHIRPEDREFGYAEISRVLADTGVVLLNLPLDGSDHVDEFERGVSMRDCARLAEVIGGVVYKSEIYQIEEQGLSFCWVEIRRWK
jgi:SAM-dependent methyltransferase